MPQPSCNWQQSLHCAAISHVGMRRANNQDSHTEVLAGDEEHWLQRGHLFIVADGMGAHAAGELASKMAVDHVSHLYQKYSQLSPPEAIHKAFVGANTTIHQRGEANAEFHRMGTTCSALLLLPQGALVAHVGDSRVYLLRGGRLHQLTFDHSLVWEMRAAGELPLNADGKPAIPRNVITRSLGPHPQVQVDLEGPFPLEPGDTFLLASDGLTGPVADEEIGAAMAHLPPDAAAQFLVDLANLRGGPDNVTVSIARIVSTKTLPRSAAASPLSVGGELDRPPAVHPTAWVTAGVASLATLGMLATQHWISAVVTLVLAAVSILVILIQRYGKRGRSRVELASGRRLGRGPHSRLDLAASPRTIGQLAAELAELQTRGANSGASAAPTLATSAPESAHMQPLAETARQLASQLRPKISPGVGDSVFDL